MIEIDGSFAGGQILRTALGLSALTSKPFKMHNIRGIRQKPGLKTQHLECVRTVAKFCNAELLGDKLGSTEITFVPGKLKSGKVRVKLPTAASVSLVLQAVMILGTSTSLKIKIEGGSTYSKWAPPMDHQANILFPLLRKMGYKVEVVRVKDGFFPKGGALVELETSNSRLEPIELLQKGSLISVHGISVATANLEKARIAERQAKAARKILFPEFDVPIEMKAYYRNAICPGTGITLWAETENSIIGADSLGEKGKSSEQVGKEAAKELVKEYCKGVVDSYTADQLLPYFAIARGGKLKTSRISMHVKTNCQIIEMFLPVSFEIDEKEATVECKKE